MLPYRDEIFDGAISIAVLHHFSTHARRVRAIDEIRRFADSPWRGIVASRQRYFMSSPPRPTFVGAILLVSQTHFSPSRDIGRSRHTVFLSPITSVFHPLRLYFTLYVCIHLAVFLSPSTSVEYCGSARGCWSTYGRRSRVTRAGESSRDRMSSCPG